MEKTEIVVVPLGEIDPPGEAQRSLIDPEKILELAESIREKGLISPILLRPLNGRFEIVAGHRRFLAHQFLNLFGIQSIIKEMDGNDVIIYRAIENLQRENLSPLDEARSYFLMRDRGGMTIEEICKATGKAEDTVKRYLRFYNMPPEFKEAVDKRSVSLGVAEKLIQIDNPFLRSQWLRIAVENGITVLVAEMWLSEYLRSKDGNRFNGIGDVSEGELMPEPKPVYVTCQCCSGAVEINKAKQIIVCGECRQQVLKMKSFKS